MGNDDWVDAFYEIAGYALTGDFPFQKMFWFTGSSGRNGKGTCVRIIERLVGDQFSTSDFDTREVRDRFFKTRFINKRLVTAGDLHNRLAKVATLKSLTGGDTQMTDVKYGDPIRFQSVAKFIFAMNQMPSLPANENIQPVAKRIMILPFDFKIKHPDAYIENVFFSELSGIFNKAIEGLRRINEKGDKGVSRGFTDVQRGQNILEVLMNEKSSVEHFICDYLCEAGDNEGLFISDLWNEYTKFMDDMHGGVHWKNDKDQPVTNKILLGSAIKKYFTDNKNMSLRIEKKYYPLHKNRMNKYFNLKWRQQDMAEENDPLG